MKKLIALLLALCLIFGMVACGGAGDSTDGTGSTGNSANSGDTGNSGNSGDTGNSGNSGDTGNSGNVDEGITASATYTPSGKFTGKTVEIWGISSDMYNDFTNMGNGTWLWLLRAACEEWAALNGAKIVYAGEPDTTALMTSINNGDKPDLMIYANLWPAAANLGLLKSFTQEQYDLIASHIGTRWLELRNYQGGTYGLIWPWTGVSCTYYNKSMFERYDVKTPGEYYAEGKWTNKAVLEIAEQMSRDLDGDGVKDTYLSSSFSGIPGFGPNYRLNEDGTLSHTLDEQQSFDKLSALYEYWTQKQCIAEGTWNITTNVTYPMFAIQSSDAEFWNFEHVFNTLKNGDIIEVCPKPYYDDGKTTGQNTVTYWPQGASLLKSCDEVDASVDLLCYLLRCGMKWMEDMSMGLVETHYEGLTGACDYSAKYLKKFKAVLNKREKALAKLDIYDEEHMKMLIDYAANAEIYTTDIEPYGVKSWTAAHYPEFASILQVPPASSIPLIRPAVEAMVQQYNDLYVNKK